MEAITDLHESVGRLIGKEARALALSFFLAINPVPASRPRVTRWGTYYGKKYTAFKTAAEITIHDMGHDPVTGQCVVHVEMIVEKPKTSKLSTPRGDVDNYLKSIMDAMTKGKCWDDDDQVVMVAATKRFADVGEQPGFNVNVYEV